LISDKIKNKSRPQIKETKIDIDNPYKMYPEIDGFINLRSNYTYQPKQNIKKSKNIFQNNLNHEQNPAEININHDLKIIVHKLLENITKKCLNLVQKDKLRESLYHTLRGIKKIMLF